MSQELEERALEYQKNFSYENFRVIRKELFAHMRDPSLTIRPDGVTFNAACINKLEGVVYIKMLLDDVAKQLAIKQCSPDERHALRWCIQKEDGTRKSRKMKGEDFADMVYDLMGWESIYRYKLQGMRINYQGESLYLFDLSAKEAFLPQSRDPETGKIKRPKPILPSEWLETFGLSVDEHRASTEIDLTEGFVSSDLTDSEPAAEQLPITSDTTEVL